VSCPCSYPPFTQGTIDKLSFLVLGGYKKLKLPLLLLVTAVAAGIVYRQRAML
jgi:hypothetical protein